MAVPSPLPVALGHVAAGSDRRRLLERAATVGEYCEHHSACPEYRVQSEPAAADSDTPAEAATPRGAPFLESVLVTLLSRLGYREADALALPLGRALLHYFTYWELEGRIELVNDEDAAQAIAFSEEADRLTKAGSPPRTPFTPPDGATA